MGQFWKSYHVFLGSTWLKVWVYLGYPLVLLGISGWLWGQSAPEGVVIALASCFIITVENLLDLAVFEGIGEKDTNKLEYLKTSVRGMKILHASVVADAVRRAATVVIVLGIPGLLYRETLGFAEVLIAVSVTLGFVELGLLITRMITMMMAKFLAIYLGATFCILSMEFLWSNGNIWGNACIACGFYLIVAAVGRMIIMGRARGSFYD